MSPRRILLVLTEPPLPFAQAASRWYYVLLRGLAERGHEVTAFASCSKPDQIAEALELFPAPGHDLRCFPHPRRSPLRSKWETLKRPFSYMFSSEMTAQLDEQLKAGFDILHLEQVWSGWLGLEHTRRALVNVHYLASIDLSEAVPAGLRDRLGRRLMLQTERRLLRAYSHVATLTPRLAREVERINPEAEATSIGIGLDLDRYRYRPEGARAPVVSLIGNMGWYPSRSAAERLLTRIWPRIRERVPAARLEIVGWSARSALAAHVDTPGVTIEEDVADTEPYFERSSLLLYAPARGSGMKIKVLEALAYGVPVVTTSEGAEGLPAEDGVHLGLADDDSGLIERATALLADPGLQDQQRKAGRALLEDHCSPNAALDRVEALYERAFGAAPSPRSDDGR